MDELKQVLEKKEIEDVSWLCSLSESELDFLISIKILVDRRLKLTFCEELAKKFDLKMLRAIGAVLMEYFNENAKDLSLSPSLIKSAAFMDSCNLSKCDPENILSIEELTNLICFNVKKRSEKRRRLVGRKQTK